MMRPPINGCRFAIGFARPVIWAMALMSWLGTARADVTTYTSSSDFFDALGDTPIVIEDYESYDLDSTIPPGTELMGVTYTTWPTVFGGLIGDDFANLDAQSLYLERDGIPGQGEQDFFFNAESFTTQFSIPITAVGMFFNVFESEDVSDYMFINTPVGQAFTGGPEQDTGTFFFAGLISTEPFSGAIFGSTVDAPSGWNADNLIMAPIPEPTALACLLVGLGIASTRRRVR